MFFQFFFSFLIIHKALFFLVYLVTMDFLTHIKSPKVICFSSSFYFENTFFTPTSLQVGIVTASPQSQFSSSLLLSYIFSYLASHRLRHYYPESESMFSFCRLFMTLFLNCRPQTEIFPLLLEMCVCIYINNIIIDFCCFLLHFFHLLLLLLLRIGIEK